MKRLTSFLLAALSPVAVGCSGLLDLGGDGDQAPAPAGEKPAQGNGADPSDPKTSTVDCGSIPTAPVEIFRSPGSETFNVMRIASDGTHVYLAGHMPMSASGPSPVPDPNDPMKTATLVRVPVGGGAREVVDFEHGQVSRGVALDASHVYWASEYQDSVLVRPKSGGPIESFALAGEGIPQSLATDGAGNLFWATWYGGIAVRPAGATSAQTFQATAGDDDDASWVTADAQSVYWLAGRKEIRSAPVGGGSPTTLATGIEHTYTLVTDDDHVWGVSNDAVWKVPKAGGDRVVVATPNTGRDFRALAVTEDAIYFSDDMEPLAGGGPVVKGPVYKANKDGTNVTAITGDLDGADFLVADACRIYWRTFDWVGNPGYETVVYARAR
jgi:hypothetical protein